ncbi:MAG: carboxypeptidase regulatory-like domain-containing protein, partial [Acidobacteria bacterium]|nr:carboxypeptidase regulatory-like domain-containing protein [Acidobacteriota bacterium]
MRFGKLFVVALGCLLLVPVVAAAQTTLAGQVSDNTGGVLPGVTVEAASPALIEGSRVAVTDGTGQYTIIDLRPGLYSLTFTLPGFGTQVRDELVLASDTTMTIDVSLSVGSIEESVTVSGESPVVDVQQVERTEVLTREVLAAIPTGNSLYSFGTLVPGIRTSLPDIGGARAMEQVLIYGNGAGGMDTTVLVDGMQVNSAIGNGAYQMYFNPQMSAETAFTTAGAGADTQRGGIRVNMIPKDGGNQFSGMGYFGGSHRSWQSDVWNPRFGELGVQSRAQGDARDGVPRIDRVYDLNASLGGPIITDKLWFFGSVRDWSTDLVVLNSFFRNGDPGLDDNRLTSGLMRLTYQANSRNKFSAYLDRIRKVRSHEHGEGDDIETASQLRWPILYYTAGTKWTGTLTNRMLTEFGWSLNGEAYPRDYQPGIGQVLPSDLVGCFSTPCFPAVGSAQHLRQLPTGDPWYGGPGGQFIAKRDDRLGYDEYDANREGNRINFPFKQNVIGSVSYVTGSHNLKVGFENSWSWYTRTRISNGNLFQDYGDDPNPFGNTTPIVDADSIRALANLADGLPPGLLGDPLAVVVYNDPSIARVNIDYDGGIYAQDSWTIDRLTLN